VNSRPQFKPWFRCEMIPSEGVILLSDRGHSLLPGNLYLRVAPLLDGRHTADEIATQLKGEIPVAEVFYAIETLRRGGYLTDVSPSLPPEQAAFWDTASIDADVAGQASEGNGRFCPLLRKDRSRPFYRTAHLSWYSHR
jgi:ribosomal protein S12 methylthiotransferase accessory factor